jgi:DNA-directed RNA polymerase specialized sigma24 family protein
MANSVSEWLVGLKSGEAVAVERLWRRYACELVNLARTNLGNFPKALADEDDVAQSVFSSMCRGAAAGRFAELKSRDELWWLLLRISKQKVVNYIRRESAQKRGFSVVYNESDAPIAGTGSGFLVLDQLIGDAPTADLIVSLDEEFHRLLGLLDDKRLQKIAILRVEGYTVPEIANRLTISIRSVERKLQLIREAWCDEFSEAHG